MGDPATVPQKMTLEEFYAWTDRQEEPFELFDGVPVPLYPEPDENGVVRAMAGGTWDHHTVISNIASLLTRRKPAGCRVGAGAVIELEGETGRTRLPDVLLSCAQAEKGVRGAPAPVLLVEVLSPGTSDVDKGQKLDEYQQLPSVKEVWLVDSTRRWAKIYRRVEGGWFVSDAIGQGGFRSEVLGGEEVSLDELYADTPV